jgi:hypothetical protein
MRKDYFEKHTFCDPFIRSEPPSSLAAAVIIPAYEEQNVICTLESLLRCKRPPFQTEILVIINDSESSPQEVKNVNKEVYKEVNLWIENNSINGFSFYAGHFKDLPAKKAGVGLARKIGMDEAARRFQLIGKNGILICLDADCLVREDYLIRIFQYFKDHPDKECASVYFEHPVDGNKYPKEVYRSIVDYELHLRYLRQAQVYIDLPFAYHTVGSAMAVRSDAYLVQGGMNTRQAGEDFYFLHKFTRINKCGSINNTAVFPSPRPSGRVPFGTGKAIQKALDGTDQKTYNLGSFELLRPWISNPETIPSQELNSYLTKNKWLTISQRIRGNTASEDSYRKQFFQCFDAFKLIKYLHFMRDRSYPDQPVRGEAIKLAKKVWEQDLSNLPTLAILEWYREKDRIN